MANKTKIFILGATGYIGGTVLQRLREHPIARNSEITALVRSEKKISLFESIGINVVHGTLDDAMLLERQASGSDIVFACADNEHIQSHEAILRGLKKKHQRTGTVPLLFHTAVQVQDRANGMYMSDIIWNDMDLEQMKELASSGPEHLSDLLVLEADKQGYVRTHIIIPTSVYGFATGPLVDLGIQRADKSEMLWLVKDSIERKRAGMSNLGLNRYGLVHIDDVGDLFMVVYNAILDGRANHGLRSIYFAENGERSDREIGEWIGEALVEFGVCRPGEETPTPYDEELEGTAGSNARCVGNRGRVLGWKPKYGNEDLAEILRDLVRWVLEQKGRMD